MLYTRPLDDQFISLGHICTHWSFNLWITVVVNHFILTTFGCVRHFIPHMFKICRPLLFFSLNDLIWNRKVSTYDLRQWYLPFFFFFFWIAKLWLVMTYPSAKGSSFPHFLIISYLVSINSRYRDVEWAIRNTELLILTLTFTQN